MPIATVAVLHDHHTDLQLTEIEVDDPRPDEVLVRIVASGLPHGYQRARRRHPFLFRASSVMKEPDSL
jgi:Zn-dependent alcohol dehydrogenase